MAGDWLVGYLCKVVREGDSDDSVSHVGLR